MKSKKYSTTPLDAKDRIKGKPIICYPINDLKESNLPILHRARKNLKSVSEIIIPQETQELLKLKRINFLELKVC